MKMKRSEIVAAVLIAAFVVVVLVFGLYPSLRQAPAQYCLANLQHLATALNMYATSNDGYMPPGDRWADALAVFHVDDRSRLGCPDAKPTADDLARIDDTRTTPPSLGYSLLRELGGQRLHYLAEAERTPVLFDSSDLRANSSADASAMSFRHPGRAANVLFAAGDVKVVTEVPVPASPLFIPLEERVEPEKPTGVPEDPHAGH